MKKTVQIKNILVGGGNQISVQSMTNTPTSDAKKTLMQIAQLEKANCDLVRISVPNEKSAKAIKEIVANTYLPVIGDFHYGLKLAIKAVENGIHKVRINPSNAGEVSRLKDLAKLCKERNVPIRIGVNSGSIHKSYKDLPIYEALAKSAYDYQKLFEDYGFEDLILSVKSSDVVETIKAYRMLDSLSDCPLHLGVTEAGTYENGIIKSAIGIGSLLADGIGDTIRVSLTTDDLADEVRVGKKILNDLHLLDNMVDVVCCPTCARTEIEVRKLANMVEKEVQDINKRLKIAVMGCIVNGIGEGADADLGIAGGKNHSVIISKGKILEHCDNDKLMDAFKKRLHEML